jgi:hypothetical protein
MLYTLIQITFVLLPPTQLAILELVLRVWANARKLKRRLSVEVILLHSIVPRPVAFQYNIEPLK